MRSRRLPSQSSLPLATAWFEPSTLALLRIENITPVRASATVDGAFRPALGARGPLRVELGAERLEPVEAVVEMLEDHQDTRRLELRLSGVRADVGLKLASFARLLSRIDGCEQSEPHREPLMNPAEIRGALRYLVESRAVAIVQHMGKACSLRAIDFDAVTDCVRWQVEGPTPQPPFLLTTDGYNSVYRLPVQCARSEGGFLVTSAPPWMESVRSRRSKRADAERGLSVVFDHPVWPRLRIERDVLDLTMDGLSFRAADDDSVFPGLSTPTLFVLDSEGQSIRLRATIKTYRWFTRQRSWGYGCAVEPASAGDAQRWQKLCEEHLFPTTRRGAADVWSVYRASGYFGLSDTLEGDFEHLRDAYVNASRALSAAPHLGVQSTWPKKGEPRATVTNLRLYRNSWFSFHLAAQPDQMMAARSAQVLRDLYRQYVEHSLYTKGPRWQLAYVQHSAHWSMRMHVEIPKKYESVGQALIQDFRAYDVRAVGACAVAPLSDAHRVCIASRSELVALLPVLTASLPFIYCDALDYSQELFALDELKAEWATHGLERERELLVAYERDVPVAFGVVETAEPGLHLFGLLDTLRLYAVRDEGKQAFSALLDAARAWFRQRGRRTFCFLEEQGVPAGAQGYLKLMSSAYFTLLSIERLPEMLEKLYSDTATP